MQRFCWRVRSRLLAALLTLSAVALLIYGSPELVASRFGTELLPEDMIAEGLDQVLGSQLALARLTAAAHASPTAWGTAGPVLTDLLGRPPMTQGGNILLVDPTGHAIFSAAPGGEADAVPADGVRLLAGGPKAVLVRPGSGAGHLPHDSLVGIGLQTYGPDGRASVMVQVVSANVAASPFRTKDRRWLLVDDHAVVLAAGPAETSQETPDGIPGFSLPPGVEERLWAAIGSGQKRGAVIDHGGAGWSFRHLEHWPVSVVVEPKAPVTANHWRIALAMLLGAIALVIYGTVAGAGRASSRRADKSITDPPFRIESDERMQVLASGVAHELNNVLTSMSLDAEAAALGYDDDTTLARLVGSITASVERSSRLTHQLLAYAGRQPLLPTTFDLRDELVRRRASLAALLSGDQRLVLSLPETALPVLLDADALARSLSALILNASAATGRDGVIGIKAGLDRSDRQARLQVIDQGGGMLPAILRRACDPFFTTRRGGRHLGLGLAVASGFARQSGGKLTLESRPALGTTATLLLPLAAAVPARPASWSLTWSRGAGPTRVLVVEDNAVVRASLAHRLRQDGFDVIEADNALQALDLLESGVDLLMTDVVLDDAMDGVALALRARAKEPLLPLVFISGFMSARLPELLAGDELATFVRKPVNGAELNAVLDGLMALREFRRQQGLVQRVGEGAA